MNLKEDFWKKAMSKIIYDVIQRFEVENGVPRLVSTNIQVIEGGEDLLSLAISMLTKLGFYEKFDENRTSQYIGYRLKNPGKGAKRYQLVLAQRKEGLCISIPKDVFQPEILEIKCWSDCIIHEDNFGNLIDTTDHFLGRFWILPSKEDIFLEVTQSHYPNTLNGEVRGKFYLNPYQTFSMGDYDDYEEAVSMEADEFKLEQLGESSSYLILYEDKLFPYMWQVCIISNEVLEEFINHFAKILMEKN
ncbi:hypothetical protein VB638_20345 [Dolichospermum sp. UHCC 0684]|jgi:hypothetical protein|uniref:hypothetical protein n=1 Tax=unclassified Dolichospermum TaxID=2622029 RepID=UPI001445E454|nr:MULTISPECIES: hypothetical protein [unclassified Dolichospermum]MEA5531892.1 hypothetical protein [Dolichospermum sp. UHCC 0684]MTJ35650.1 hypothetical protein [Dolichospermum sp. UHCC 0260]